MLVPLDKTRSCLGPHTCYLTALSVSPGKYLPSWLVDSATSHSDGFVSSSAKYVQVVLSTVPAILSALSVSLGKYLPVFLSIVLPAILMAVVSSSRQIPSISL